jgi:glycosyltransferase involved in cell wall biosynthesis
MNGGERTWVLALEDSRKGFMGGGQRGTLEVMEALAPHFRLLLGDTDGQGPFAREAARRGIERIELLGIRARSRGGALRLHWREVLAYPLHLLLNARRLRRALARRGLTRRAVLVYAGHKKMLPLAWVLRATQGIRFVAHARTLEPPGHPLLALLRRLYGRAERVLAVSRAVADQLDLERVVVIPNPLTCAVAPAPKARPDPFVVAVFASLLDSKGIEVFMRAHGLLENSAAIVFEVYGRGPLEERLRELETPRARLMGWTDAVPRVLAERVAVTCVPSTTPESFGRVALEGFACGIPCVSTGLGGQGEIVHHERNGLVVRPGDPTALAAAVDRLYRDPALWQRLAGEALQTARAYEFGRFAEQIRDEFSRTLTHSTRV